MAEFSEAPDKLTHVSSIDPDTNFDDCNPVKCILDSEDAKDIGKFWAPLQLDFSAEDDITVDSVSAGIIKAYRGSGVFPESSMIARWERLVDDWEQDTITWNNMPGKSNAVYSEEINLGAGGVGYKEFDIWNDGDEAYLLHDAIANRSKVLNCILYCTESGSDYWEAQFSRTTFTVEITYTTAEGEQKTQVYVIG